MTTKNENISYKCKTCKKLTNEYVFVMRGKQFYVYCNECNEKRKDGMIMMDKCYNQINTIDDIIRRTYEEW